MDIISKENRSRNMSAVKGKNTAPELLVRKTLFRLGYRFRIHYKLPGKPDIAFIKNRKAIFIHGCFWHLHRCKLSTIPKSNTAFWQKKLNDNKKRDAINIKLLHIQNWETLILWECELKESKDKMIKKSIQFIEQ